MNSIDLASKANSLINQWKVGYEKLIVAIDGYTGVGKTTFLQNLSQINDQILPVNRDDFLFSRKIVEGKLATADDKSKIFEFEVNDDKKLIDFINAYKNSSSDYTVDTYNYESGVIDVQKSFDFSKPILVIEGVFLFHPELSLNGLWDRRIFLHGKLEEIDKRRVEREKKRWGDDYYPETNLDSYFRLVTIALKRYFETYHPEQLADLVLEV